MSNANPAVVPRPRRLSTAFSVCRRFAVYLPQTTANYVNILKQGSGPEVAHRATGRLRIRAARLLLLLLLLLDLPLRTPVRTLSGVL